MKTHAARNSGILSAFSREIRLIPLLSREEEMAIAKRALEGDQKARDRLIVSNLRFVLLMARRYQKSGLPLEDLVDEGCIGLMHAVDRFDPDRGFHFLSYAVWWIRQAILRAIGENSRMIRLPSHRVKILSQIERLKNAGLKNEGVEPELEVLASQMHIDAKSVLQLLLVAQNTVSLDAPMESSDGVPLGDAIEDRRAKSMDEAAMDENLKRDIDTILSTLPQREASILQDRFGLHGSSPKSLEEIGSEYRLTKERIRQIEQKALRKLRHSPTGARLRAYLW